MARKTSYAPGQFCWTDLLTTDPAGAKAFYGTLFGWYVEEVPGSDYAMLQKDHLDVASLGELPAEQRGHGVPSHWNAYVSVADLEAVVAKAVELGGKVLLPPGAVDVGDFGRMAVIADPTGAALGLWQPKQHSGSAFWGEPGAPCWFELQTKDPARAKEFFTKLFGWETGGDARYTEWIISGEHSGGMIQIEENWGPVPPNWSVYFQVENVEETVGRAQSLGAKLCMPPMEIGTTGKCAMFMDPQGAPFYVYAHKAR